MFIIKDILSMDKHNFVESAQFNYLHDLEWLIEQYPNEKRKKPLLVIYDQKQEGELTPLVGQFQNVELVKVKLFF